MDFHKGEISGITIKELEFYSDERGWLAELFRRDELEEYFFPEMCYVSMTKPGVTRGPHEHVNQTDYFAFHSSTFKLYLWDNRNVSKTFRNKKILVVGKDNPKCVKIPPGVVHAYKNIGSANGLVMNFPNKLFAGIGKKEPVDEIRHEDDPDTIFKVS